MVSEFLERNESGQKTFSGREFVKPRLHYGDPIVPPGHCDAPPLPVTAIRPPCHCGAPPPSLRYALTVIASSEAAKQTSRVHRHCDAPPPVIASSEAAKQTMPRPSSLRHTTPRHCEQRSCEANHAASIVIASSEARSKPAASIVIASGEARSKPCI